MDEILKDVKEEDVQLVKEDADDGMDLEKAGNESPIIRFVNYVIQDAIKQGASDIHIEPKEKALKIRYRIDGTLYQIPPPAAHLLLPIVSRIKILAKMESPTAAIIISAPMIASITMAMAAICIGLDTMWRTIAKRVPSGSSAMPHVGQVPGVDWRTARCIGHV